jgi:hypothetical protein
MIRHSGGPGGFSEIDILRVKAMANEEIVDFHLSHGFLRLSHGDPNIIPGFCPVEMTQQLASQWIFFTLLPRKRQMRLSGNRVPQSYGLSRYT